MSWNDREFTNKRQVKTFNTAGLMNHSIGSRKLSRKQIERWWRQGKHAKCHRQTKSGPPQDEQVNFTSRL